MIFSQKNNSTEKKWEEIFPTLNQTGIDLISRMLVIDPQKRISAYEALNHEFFKNSN
jgi:cyclin-dependent kinase